MIVEVYIEIVILDNFLIDFILLFVTAKLLKIKINKNRMIFSALIGSLFSIFCVNLQVTGILLYLIKIFISTILIYFAFKPTKIKQLLLQNTLFVFLTFILGGICFGISFMLDIMQLVNNQIIWNGQFPISFILISIFLFIYFGYQFYNYFKIKNKLSSFFYNIQLINGEFCYDTVAYLDTGNYLKDKTNKPYILINEEVFQNLLKNKIISADKQLDKCNQLTINTLSGNKRQIMTFSIDKIVIYSSGNRTIHNNVNVAVSPFNFSNQINAEVILSPYLFN